MFDCHSKRKCKFCKNHFLVSCSNKPISHNHEIKEATQPSNASTTPLNPSATSWVGSTRSFPSPHNVSGVALQTALARVEGRNESRVCLFHSGSQKTFIFAKVVDKLDLKPLREESLGIKTFGQSKPELKKRAVYELLLEPLKNNGKSGNVEAFLVDVLVQFLTFM